MLLRLAVLTVLLLLSLGACGVREQARVATLAAPYPKPGHFTICHGNSCRLRSPVSLAPEEWAQVQAMFEPRAADAVSERRRIALAIGRLETFAGDRTGTSIDAPGMGVHWRGDKQLDCIDEAANTTQYLRMLAHDGLLRWHRPGQPAHRFVWWPSNTATILEKETGKRWAVDSYFLANGEPASVVPMPVWLAGWSPEDGAAPESY